MLHVCPSAFSFQFWLLRFCSFRVSHSCSQRSKVKKSKSLKVSKSQTPNSKLQHPESNLNRRIQRSSETKKSAKHRNEESKVKSQKSQPNRHCVCVRAWACGRAAMVSNSRVTLSIMIFDKVGDAEDKNEFSTYQKSKIESDVGSVEWKSGVTRCSFIH